MNKKLSYKERQALKRKISKEIIKQILLELLLISLMTLRDRYGFGKKRLGDFTEHFFDLFDSIDKDYLTLEDIKQTIYDETGVKIE